MRTLLLLAVVLASCSSSTTPASPSESGDTGAGADVAVEGGAVADSAVAADASSDASFESPETWITLFGAYCTGATLVEKEASRYAKGSWSPTGEMLPVGTKVALGRDSFKKWNAYAMTSTGAVMLRGPNAKGVDFSTDCTADPAVDEGVHVVLQRAHVYAEAAHTGAACVLPAGTPLPNYSVLLGDSVRITSDNLDELCGYTQGYTDGTLTGTLLRR